MTNAFRRQLEDVLRWLDAADEMESPDSLPSVRCNIDATGRRPTLLVAMDVDPASSPFLTAEEYDTNWISGVLRAVGWVGPVAAIHLSTDPRATLPDLSVITSPNSRKRGQSPSSQVWDSRPSRVAHPTTSASSNTHLPTTPTPYHPNLAIFGIALHRTDNTANYSINSKINDNKNNMQSVKIRLVLDNKNYFERKNNLCKNYRICNIPVKLCVPQFIKNNYSNVNAIISKLKQRKYKVIEMMIDTKNLGAFPLILENKSRCYKKTVDNVCDSKLIVNCILINQIFGSMPENSIPELKNAITVQGIVYGHPHSHSFNPNLMYSGGVLSPLSMNKSDYAFISKTCISTHYVFIESSDSVSMNSIRQKLTKNWLYKAIAEGVEYFPKYLKTVVNTSNIVSSVTRSQTDNKTKTNVDECVDNGDALLSQDSDDDDDKNTVEEVPYVSFKNGELIFKSLLRLTEEAPAKISRLLSVGGATKLGGWHTPSVMRLVGGGESSLNAASGWGSPPNANSNSGGTNNWSGNTNSGNQTGAGNNMPQQWANANQRPPGSQADGNSNKLNNVASGGTASGSVAPPTGPSGNWGGSGPNQSIPASSQSNSVSQVIPPAQVNTGGNNSPGATSAGGPVIVLTSNSVGTSTSAAVPPTGKAHIEQLNTMREALFSQDGWGGQHVNQDTNWDVPTSPEPGVKLDQQGGPPVWKPNINNGTDLWEANLRNGGQPPPQPVAKTPWGHTPTSNIGGTWGEDDDAAESSNVWTGPPPPQQWGAPPQQPPHWNAPGNKKDDWGGWGEPHRSEIHRPDMHTRDLRPPAPDHRDMRVMMGMDGRGGDMRGDPHGISGRLNGSADMWGQHHMPHMQAPPNKMMPSNVGNGVNQWGTQGPKDMGMSKTVTGWEEPSPPAARRNMPNFDDGTSLWGQQRTAVAPWKDMPGGMGRGAMQCPPVMPPNRMPGVAPNPMKPDAMWGHHHRNGSWEDSSGHSGNWEKEPTNSWNEGPMNQAGWAGSKSKPMGVPGGSWDADMGDWRGPKPPVGGPSSAKLFPKDMIWNSKQFRLLVDMGYKKDDVELALRNTNMNVDESMDILGQMRGNGGMETWRRHEEHPGGPPFDHQQQYPAPPRPQHPSFPQQQPPNVPFPQPGQGLASIGNMPAAVVQKILNPSSSQPPPSFNQQNNQSGGNGQPSTAQLRMLVQQIQMAVAAGYLNNQILNQPLAPQTLVLLNQLLQQIKALQQLASTQHSLTQNNTASGKGNVALHLTVQITKAKQQISNLQNQIASQQAIYVKQQASAGSSSTTTGGDFFTKPHDSLTLPNNFSDLTLSKDAPSAYGSSGGQQSRLNQWKLPSVDKEEGSEFSRAPGTTTKSTTSPQLNPLALQSDSTWSSGRPVSDGWPTSDADLPDGKEPWPSSQPPQTSTYTDLVPEFEPGKPWKGNQMKSIEDDPAITPGSVVRSPLSLAAIKDPTDIFGSGNQGKASPTTPSERSLSSSTWSYPPPSPASTPSSFNIGKGSSSKTWGDTPTTGASDLWGSGASMTKSRGQLPAASAPKPTSSWGGGSAQTQRPPSYTQQPNWQSTWLLLKNLTAQIDGSTLKTLCMQHGPLQSFHLYLNQGIALSKYSTRDEASKAQSALNNCVLGNTTIFAETPADADVNMIQQHLGQGAGGSQWRGTGSKGAGGPTSSDPWSFSLWESQLEQRATPSSLASFLSPDLLGGESM